MRVLFVSSANSSQGISPIVINQGESLIKQGIDITYFGIMGKGFWGYIKNAVLLRKHLKKNHFNIIHSHYSSSAFAASLAGSRPHVVSLMGSDVKSSFYERLVIKIFSCIFWDACIVKSADMQKSSGLGKSFIIPNGVNLDSFTLIGKENARQFLGWENDKKIILFLGNQKRFEKNYPLAEAAIKLLNDPSVVFKVANSIRNDELYKYYCGSDLLILTSRWEGSPNAVKEAMACNSPVVATDVGDVRWLFGNEPGYFITGFEPEEVASKIKRALAFSEENGRTNGRKRIIELGLDAETVANKIIKVYKNCLDHKAQILTN